MIIVGTEKDYKLLRKKCDGRCANGLWCIFADGEDSSLCPIANEDNFIVVKKNKYDLLEVE